MREYHAEFRLGLRRSGPLSSVEAKMDERKEQRDEYLRAWAAANKERRSAARKEQRRLARAQALAGALGNVTFK